MNTGLNDVLTVDERLDSDGDIQMTLPEDTYYCYLNRNHAIDLVQHLVRVFGMTQRDLAT